MALAVTMCTSVHISIHGIMCVSMMSMCMPCMVCMYMRTMFLAKHDSKRVWFMAHWLKVEPKQSTLFFKTHISFATIEEEVEHAIDTLEGEATSSRS